MIHLYTSPYCFFCKKVEAYLVSHNITFTHHDITSDEHARQVLVEKGGKLQVPFLIDEHTDTAMYESDDIIAYLHKTYETT